MPGTYVHSAKGEFGVARDTLVITLQNGVHYRLERRVSLSAIRQGKVLPEKHRREVFEAVLDADKLELSEPISGRVFRFDRAKRILLLNRTVYRKL